MTRKEAFSLHQCKACVLYDSKRKECKQLDLPLYSRAHDICPVDERQHRIWEKAVKERRIR